MVVAFDAGRVSGSNANYSVSDTSTSENVDITENEVAADAIVTEFEAILQEIETLRDEFSKIEDTEEVDDEVDGSEDDGEEDENVHHKKAKLMREDLKLLGKKLGEALDKSDNYFANTHDDSPARSAVKHILAVILRALQALVEVALESGQLNANLKLSAFNKAQDKLTQLQALFSKLNQIASSADAQKSRDSAADNKGASVVPVKLSDSDLAALIAKGRDSGAGDVAHASTNGDGVDVYDISKQFYYKVMIKPEFSSADLEKIGVSVDDLQNLGLWCKPDAKGQAGTEQYFADLGSVNGFMQKLLFLNPKLLEYFDVVQAEDGDYLKDAVDGVAATTSSDKNAIYLEEQDISEIILPYLTRRIMDNGHSDKYLLCVSDINEIIKYVERDLIGVGLLEEGGLTKKIGNSDALTQQRISQIISMFGQQQNKLTGLVGQVQKQTDLFMEKPETVNEAFRSMLSQLANTI